MNVASRELCKELYELSGWAERCRDEQDGSLSWYTSSSGNFMFAPKYNLGYLLRKMPQTIDNTDGYWEQLNMAHDNPEYNPDCWLFRYGSNPTLIAGRADTPEDAAAKLCIELFKQGILTREPQS